MKIIRADEYFDWEYVVTKNLGETYVKLSNTISVILNISLPLFLLLHLKVDVFTYFLCFIALDIALSLIDLVFVCLAKSFQQVRWLLYKIGFTKEIKNLSPEEIEAYKKSIDSYNDFAQEKLKLLNNQLEEYKSLDKIISVDYKKNELIFVEEMIAKFRAYDEIDWIKNSLLEIANVSDRLLNLVKEDIDAINIIINTYNIYSEELLAIIKKYEEMDEEQQSKYTEKVEKLIDTFLVHLEKQETKVIKFRERSIDFDIDFLSKKLEEMEEEQDV